MWNGCSVKNVFPFASVPCSWSLCGYSGTQRLFDFTPVVRKTAFSSVGVVESTFWHGFLKFLLWEGFW